MKTTPSDPCVAGHSLPEGWPAAASRSFLTPALPVKPRRGTFRARPARVMSNRADGVRLEASSLSQKGRTR